jgi:hypothetical protein
MARDAMSNGAVDLDPSLKAVVQGQINEKIARAGELVSSLQAGGVLRASTPPDTGVRV